MQIFNKKLWNLAIILCITLPLNGMFTPKTFNRLKQMKQKISRQRPFGLSQPININIKPTISQPTEIKKPNFFSWFSNWWSSPPLEQKLSTLSTNVETTIKTAATNLSTNIESKQILNKLRKDQYVSDSSKETIQTFLENNNSDNIKDVFNETIKYLGGADQLIKICTNNPSLATKLLPFIQESLANPSLITTPVSKSSYEPQNILLFTSKILLQLSHTSDSAQIHTISAQIHTINEIKKQLLQILIAHPFYITYLDTQILLTILPDDSDNFITIIKKWDTQIKFEISGTGKMTHQYSRSFDYAISDLLLQKIMHEKSEKNKEELCTIFLENEYASIKIEKIASNDIGTISAIISAFKKKLLTDDIYKPNFHLLAKEIFDLTSKSDPSLIKDLTNDLISVLKKKFLTNDIYKNNFDLFTMDTLAFIAKKSPLLIKDLTNTIISVLKEKLLTDNTYSEYFCSLIIDIIHFTRYTNPPLAEDFANAILAQFKKASKSDAGLNLLTKILPVAEILEKTFNINKKYANTASYKHLKEYAYDVIENFPTIFSNPNLITMIQDVLKKEKELNDLGYETFYHGRRWKYGLLSDIYTMLFEYKSGKKLNNFIPTHLDDPALGEKINPLFFKSEKAKHALLLKKGNVPNDSIGIAGYETLLFLNKFLFGNIVKLGESSIDYMLENRNVSDIKLSISEIFAMFGDSVVYNTYKQQLQELEQEYTKLSKHGELLLIAVPKNRIKDYVYYTVYSPGENGQRKSLYVPGVGKTFDIEKILEYQNKYPKDTGGQYSLINTKTAGLDPNSGIQMFPFNAVDTDKMKAFKEKEHALFAEIIQSMKKEDNKKAMKTLSRE